MTVNWSDMILSLRNKQVLFVTVVKMSSGRKSRGLLKEWLQSEAERRAIKFTQIYCERSNQAYSPNTVCIMRVNKPTVVITSLQMLPKLYAEA